MLATYVGMSLLLHSVVTRLEIRSTDGAMLRDWNLFVTVGSRIYMVHYVDEYNPPKSLVHVQYTVCEIVLFSV